MARINLTLYLLALLFNDFFSNICSYRGYIMNSLKNSKNLEDYSLFLDWCRPFTMSCTSLILINGIHKLLICKPIMCKFDNLSQQKKTRWFENVMYIYFVFIMNNFL